MIIESILTSVIIGKLRKGRIDNIFEMKIKGWYFLLIALLVNCGALFVYNSNMGGFGVYVEQYLLYIQAVTYGLCILTLIMNLKYWPMIIVLLGTLGNAAATLMNLGKQPIAQEMVKYVSGYHLFDKAKMLMNVVTTGTTKLHFLGDIVGIPYPYGMSKVVSIGDVVIFAGIFMFIQTMMGSKKRFDCSTRMVEFGYRTN